MLASLPGHNSPGNSVAVMGGKLNCRPDTSRLIINEFEGFDNGSLGMGVFHIFAKGGKME